MGQRGSIKEKNLNHWNKWKREYNISKFKTERQQIKEEETLHNSFNEDNITMISKSDKEVQKRKKKKNPHRVISLEYRHEILNTILANRTQQYRKRFMHH